MDDRCLRTDPGGLSAHGGLARRPRRPAAVIRDRRGGLHAWIARLRPCGRPTLPDRRTCRSGRRRRDHVRDVARADRAGLPGPRPGVGVRPPRRDHGGRRRGRPGAGRSADEHLVALDLLRQPADRRVRPAGDADKGGGIAEPVRETARLGRLRDVQRRPRRAHVRTDSQQRRRLGIDDGDRIVRHRGGLARRLRRRRARPA